MNSNLANSLSFSCILPILRYLILITSTRALRECLWIVDSFVCVLVALGAVLQTAVAQLGAVGSAASHSRHRP